MYDSIVTVKFKMQKALFFCVSAKKNSIVDKQKRAANQPSAVSWRYWSKADIDEINGFYRKM